MMPIQAGDLVENLGYKPATPIQEGICIWTFSKLKMEN